MLDPLTAFATAGTVLQVVEFGSKILHVAIEYAQNGGSTEVASIEKYVQTLMAANTGLQTTLLKANETITPGPGRALNLANLQCLAISREIVQILRSLKLDKINWWRAARSAFREHHAKSKLKSLQAKLESAKNNLTVCFLIYSNKRQEQLIHASENLSETMRDIKDTVTQSQRLEKHIHDLERRMRNISLASELHHIDIKAILASHGEDLREISNCLDRKVFAQTEPICKLENRFILLEQCIDKELQTRSVVISSLVFPQMEDRRSNIQCAHRETYQWIFSPSVQKQCVWDNFIEWIASDKSLSIYWIRGKPGSGKSTLVKRMADELGQQSLKGDWLQGQEAIIGSSFFWIGGTLKQRSLQGLLQSLLHQIFGARPEIVPQSVSSARWQHHWLSSPSLLDWANDELKKTLHQCISNLEGSPILLFIDGLDEFDGNDDERLDMIEFLRALTALGRVKICLSSRPWNIFKDAFADCPQLRLEDLTLSDIEKFVHDSLTENDLFMRKLSRQLSMLDELTASIARLADGVFLWVRLVVRDLLKSLRDGCQISGLKRVLDSIPRDLNEYFMRMMQQMETAYRSDAARILQTKVQDLGYTSRANDTVREPPSLRLFDLHHLQEDMDSIHFVLTSDGEIMDFESCDEDVIVELFDTLERRLASRSMGLLEVFVHSRDKAGFLQAEIVYLHRTVEDFLCSIQAQKVIQSFMDRPFDALGFWCNILVARLMGPELSCHREPTYTAEEFDSWIECFLAWAQSPALDQDKMIALYEAAAPSIASSKGLYDCGSCMSFAELWAEGRSEKNENLPLALAVQAGWSNYLDSIPPSRIPHFWNGHPLLLTALRPHAPLFADPHPQVVGSMLALGADPNERYTEVPTQKAATTDSPSGETIAPRSHSVWVNFIGGLTCGSVRDRETVFLTLEIMLRAGASLEISTTDVNSFCDNNSAESSTQTTTNVLRAALESKDRIHIVDLLNHLRPSVIMKSGAEALTFEHLARLQEICLALNPTSLSVIAPKLLRRQPRTMLLSRSHSTGLEHAYDVREKRKWSGHDDDGNSDGDGRSCFSIVSTNKRRRPIRASASVSHEVDDDTFGFGFKRHKADTCPSHLTRWDSVP